MPPEMTPPRDVQDYEAQAREIVSRLWDSLPGEATERIAAALRAAEWAGLERAAQYVEAFTGYTNAACFAKEIRAMIALAPESPPAKDLRDQRIAELEAALREAQIALTTVGCIPEGEQCAQKALRKIDAALSRRGTATGKEG